MAAARVDHVVGGVDSERLGGDSETTTETPTQELRPPPLAEKRRTRSKASVSPMQRKLTGKLVTPSDKFGKAPKAQKAAQGSPAVVEAIPIKNGAETKRPKTKTNSAAPDSANKIAKTDSKRKRPEQG